MHSISFSFQIYLYQRQSQCIYFQKNDRIGIYTPEVPGSVAYLFNSSNPHALQHIADPNNPPRPGNNVTFDGLTYPYKFSAAAYLDTGGFQCKGIELATLNFTLKS